MDNHLRAIWLHRGLRWGAGIVSVYLLLALLSWLTLPSLVKKIAVEQTQETIGRKLSIGEVSFNPFRLALTVKQLVLYEPDQITPALSAEQLRLNVSSSSLLRLAAILNQVRLVAPKLHLVRLNDAGIGRYNFSDVLDRILARPSSNGKTYFALANVELDNGTILFEDKVTGKQIDIRALNIGLPALSNLPRRIDTFVQPSLSMLINGTPFSLKGRSKPFASSLDTTLAIDIDRLDLSSYLPFAALALPVKLTSATLSTTLDLNFSRATGKPQISLAGNINLDDIAVQTKDAARLLNITSVSARIKQLDVMQLSGIIDQISIETPQIWADINHKGDLNWQLASTNQKPGNETAIKAQAPAITLHKLSIHNGTINWADDANAVSRQVAQLDHISLRADELSSLRDAKPAKLMLSARENGHGQLSFDGQLTPLTAKLNGHITFDALQLSGYQNYLARAINGSLSGQLSGQADLMVADGNVQIGKLGLQIGNLKLATKDQPANNIWGANNVTLNDGNIDLQARKISANTLHIAGLNGQLKRDAKGRLNLLDLFATVPVQASIAKAQANAKAMVAGVSSKNSAPWQARLGKLVLSDSGLSYEDSSASPTQKLLLSGLALHVDNLSSELDQTSRISLQTTLNKNGKLNIAGQASAQLKTIALNLDGQNLPLAPFQSLFTDYLNVVLTSGTLSTKGQLTLIPPLNKQNLSLQYDGSANLNNLRMLDKLSASDFLRWRTLNLQGIHAKLGAQPQVVLEKITLADFYVRAILSDQGQLNLQNIVAHSSQASSAPPDTITAQAIPAATSPSVPMDQRPLIRIDQTILQRGNINFTDNFVKPNYTANMTGMNGSIGSIASNSPAPAAIDLQGKIDNDASLQISGTLNPLFKPMFLDIKASANGVQLPRLTPYSTKYAGYPITKGKLSMNVQYQIENDKLVAQNDIRIEQLSFGDHADGPSVTKLPIMLAVALLKDRNGDINLNLPISGSLSDPQFSIGGIIMRALGNLIVKAVTSPFALISSMFDSAHSGELNLIEFAPGSAELSPDIQKKLDTLGYALHQRPALKIDVMGRADPAIDSEGLRLDLLNRKIRARKQKEIIAKEGQPSASVTGLDDSERNKYLEKIYQDEKFKKPRNAIGLTKSLPPEEMQKLIIDNTPISIDDLRDLAQRRADLVRNYLQDQSIISAERIYLLAPKLNTNDITDHSAGNRVELSLQQ